MTRSCQGWLLFAGILIVMFGILTAANATGEHCSAQFPKWFGCIFDSYEGLVDGLTGAGAILFASCTIPGFENPAQEKFRLQTAEEVQAAQVTLQVVQRYERRLGDVEALRNADVQRQITEEVSELIKPLQGALEGVVKAPDISKVVTVVTETVVERTISIPKIVVLPKKQVTFESTADF